MATVGRRTYPCIPQLAGQLLTEEEIGQKVVRVEPSFRRSGDADFSYVPLSEQAWKSLVLTQETTLTFIRLEGVNIRLYNSQTEIEFRSPNNGSWVTAARVAEFVQACGNDFSFLVEMTVSSNIEPDYKLTLGRSGYVSNTPFFYANIKE